MSPEHFEMVLALTAFFGAGTFALIGMRMFLTHRARRFTAAGGGEVQALRDEVRALRDDVTAMRGDLAEVGERMDFAERLLAQARSDDPRRLPEG